MSLILHSLSVSPTRVSAANNDTTITLSYTARVTNTSNNPVEMTALIVEPRLSFVADGQLVKSCSWDEGFTTVSKTYTRDLVVRVTNPPPVVEICDIDLSGVPQGDPKVTTGSSFEFSN